MKSGRPEEAAGNSKASDWEDAGDASSEDFGNRSISSR